MTFPPVRTTRNAIAVLATLSTFAILAGCGDSRARDEATEAEPAEQQAPQDLPAMAITIDDLPWVGPLPPGWDRMEGTRRILAALDNHDAPAAAFVNCGRVPADAPVLILWLDAGHTLGNHTAEHMDLNQADTAAWADDVRACDTFLGQVTGGSPLPFRYPYLHRGPTVERRQAGEMVVAELGSVVAPVTIDTGDWILDDPYVAAIRAGDPDRAEIIAHTYLDHVVRAARHYREVARDRVGRDVPHILLLHANALLADQLDALLDRLEEDGFRFISLETALQDPVYRLEDDYVGPLGMSWLYRIPPAAPEAHAWDDAEAAALREVVR